MNRYRVEITETLQKEVLIDADDQDEAIWSLRQYYDAGYIVLDAEDHVSTDFSVMEQVREKGQSKEETR